MERLHWSKRGDVACTAHAPEPLSERWRAEGWSRIPPDADGRHGRWFQCPACSASGRCYRHAAATEGKTHHDQAQTPHVESVVALDVSVGRGTPHGMNG